jgi:S-DNA-T family DNA segregation ATPase FtsK/SpoIIIE
VPAALVWLVSLVGAAVFASGIGPRRAALTLSKIAEAFVGDGEDHGGEPEPIPETPAATTPTPEAPPAPKRKAARQRPAATKTGPGATATRTRRAPVGQRSDDLPSPDILGEIATADVGEAGMAIMAERIESTLDSFGVPAKVVEIETGPAVTRFGLQPGTVEKGGKTRRIPVSRITARKDDLALALSARTLRMEAPVPGRPVIGVEIPNPETQAVALRGLLEDGAFSKASQRSNLVVALGRDVTGAGVVADLASMPHLLIAGATGSGKSVCMHSLVLSLLFQNTPDALRLVMVDPKRVEFGRYRKLPHLVGPVVTEITAVIAVLRWTMRQMDDRYKLFAERGARDLAAYNARSPAGEAPLPKMVVFVDELADPMLIAPDETEPLIMRLAQLGRATGIHLVVATQRPSTDVVTGVIKANFPARIAFAVASGTDSRVILDTQGAETLLGSGDMLYQAPEAPKPRRVQGALVTDKEIGAVVGYWAASPWRRPDDEPPWAGLMRPIDPDERLYQSALTLAAEEDDVNVSLLQRRLRIGHARAKAVMERLRAEGAVGDRPIE